MSASTSTGKLDGVPGVDRRHRFSDLYHERTNYQFRRHGRAYLIAALVVVFGSIALLYTRGLNLGIDFEGGVSWQVTVEEGSPAVSEVRDLLEPLGLADAKISIIDDRQAGTEAVRVRAELPDNVIADVRDALAEATGTTPADVTTDATGGKGTWSVGGVTDASTEDVEKAVAAVPALEGANAVVTNENGVVSIVVDDLPPSVLDEVTNALAEYAGVNADAVTVNIVGPTWGNEVSRKAVTALVVFFFILAVYLIFRFEWKMALASILAVLHDIMFTIGFYALFQFEVTPATVTAFLTILGFSLYDTVVVFDKIQENEATLLATGRGTYTEMANRSLNEVLMRSLSTGFVALLPVASLLIVGSFMLGATALQDFALALFAGLVVGAYSSIFIATPLVWWMKEREPQFAALREREERAPIRREARAAAGARSAARSAVAGSSTGTATATAERVDTDTLGVPTDWDTTGVPGPPPVLPVRRQAPRGRQQRGRKRK